MLQFSNTARHSFKPGMLYLGCDPTTGDHVGMWTDRGAITIAGSRTGKGAASIIPNVLRAESNLFIIDPSAENVEATYEQLEQRGFAVRLLDPFHMARVPSRLRSSCNLLASVDPNSLTVRDDIRKIADGLVMRHNPDHNEWADKKQDVIAGAIAEVVTTAPPENRTLLDVVALLNLSPLADGDGPSDLEAALTMMRDNPAAAGLARRGGTTALTSLKASNKQGPEAGSLGGAQSELDWIAAMADILGASSFELSELKTGKVAVFLVLPADTLHDNGRFLRLFVRCAISAMTVGGKVGERNPNGKVNRPCLFMLDEFFSLGHMAVIQTAAGLLPKYGVHLWPFLQDLGQLIKLYGKEGAETFFSNADAHMFFGNVDIATLEYISRLIGATTLDDLGIAPPVFRPKPLSRDEMEQLAGSALALPPGKSVTTGSSMSYSFNGPNWGDSHSQSVVVHDEHYHEVQRKHVLAAMARDALADRQLQERAAFDNERMAYEHKLKQVGQPKLSPQHLRALIAKLNPGEVAQSMIVIGKGAEVFNLRLGAYFVPDPPKPLPAPPAQHMIAPPATPAKPRQPTYRLKSRPVRWYLFIGKTNIDFEDCSYWELFLVGAEIFKRRCKGEKVDLFVND